MRTGPNDVTSVVWALQYVTFFFHRLFLILIKFYYIFRFYGTKYAMGVGGAVIIKAGPNDARRVVWVLGMLLFFPHVFLKLNSCI
jgi:hypothetical protein